MAMATAFGFPVLLKNSSSGVVGSLVVSERADSVGDLIALLNSQLVACAHDNNDYIDAIYAIRLYGVELGATRRLAPLLLDQASISPRLVAYTTQRSKHAGTGQFYVKTLTGKTVNLVYDRRYLVKEIKEQIQEREGIPPDQQRLVFDGKQLEDDFSIAQYGIKPESIAHLVLKLRGGGWLSKTFADVSDGSLLVEQEFSDKAPEWRVCDQGLNIEGRCGSRTCKAFQEMVISPQGLQAFNLMEDTHATCPCCHKSIQPVTCGFYDCEWKFEGVRESDECYIASPWTEALARASWRRR